MITSGRRPGAQMLLAATLLVATLAGCYDGQEYELGSPFGTSGSKRAAVIEASVDQDDADARRKAFYEMSRWSDPGEELVDLVELSLLGETDPLVRAQVARTLGIWGRQSSVEELRLCLEKDPDVHVRSECAQALGEIESNEAQAALAGALRGDPRSDVRLAAAQSLRQHRDGQSAEALLVALEPSEDDPAVRYYAADSLRYMTGHDFGYDREAWASYLQETENPLADYGNPPKQRKAAEPTLGMTEERQQKTRQILGDLFPLEREEGPFD